VLVCDVTHDDEAFFVPVKLLYRTFEVVPFRVKLS